MQGRRGSDHESLSCDLGESWTGSSVLGWGHPGYPVTALQQGCSSFPVSFFMYFPFFQSEMKRRMARCRREAKPLPKSTCKTIPSHEPPGQPQDLVAVPDAQPPSDSPSHSSHWFSLKFSGLGAVLYRSCSLYQSPSRCSLPSLLAGVRKGHWHGKVGRERSVAISDSSPLPLFCMRSVHSRQ